jgi:hypothetical protein
MDSAKVPQHLELDDVVAWGLSAGDLLFVVAGGIAGWWTYVALSGDVFVRLVAAGLSVTAGALLGLVRVDGRRGRSWITLIGAFVARPRVLRVGGQ